jgi:hypothetical protein
MTKSGLWRSIEIRLDKWNILLLKAKVKSPLYHQYLVIHQLILKSGGTLQIGL